MNRAPGTQQVEQNSDSLGIYMRGLNELGNYSPEQQNRICGSFEAASDELRRAVCCMGFVVPEYLRSISDILENGSDPADVFLLSALQQMGSGKAAQFNALRQWQQDVSQQYQKLTKAFRTGENFNELRDELTALLLRYRLSLQRVYELLDIGRNYLQMICPDFEWGCPMNITRSPASDFVEEKMLMYRDDIVASSALISEKLKVLHIVRNELVEANLKLVVSIARRYCNQKIMLADLIQEGNLGLMRALERIDFSLGYRFSTYASWWIRHRIVRAVSNSSRVIRLPMHMVKLINDINHAEQRFIQLYDREPEIAELAKILELPAARVSAVKKMAVQTVSLQAPVTSGDDAAELGTFIADNNAVSPDAELNRRVIHERLYEMLKTLTEREQQLLIMRFGLYGQPVYTLAEISNHFKLTRERCRQIERNLLIKLRSPEKLKFLDGAVDFDDF